MLRRHLYGLLTLAVAVAIGFGSAVGVARTGAADRVASVDSAAKGESLDSQEIHQILGGSQRSQLEISGPKPGEIAASAPIPFTVENLFTGKARIRYSVELIDEFGAELVTPYRSAIEKINGDDVATFELGDHGGLGEGLFLYRVTVVGRSRQAEADDTLEIPFAVLGETVHLLDDEEWLVYSLVNGVKQ